MEDLTQDVFVRMLSSLGGEVQPDGHVFQIAQNLLVDRSHRALVRNRDAAD